MTFFHQIVYYNIHFISAFFTQRASRSRPIYFVAAGSRWITTASPADALYLDQARLVNNPG